MCVCMCLSSPTIYRPKVSSVRVVFFVHCVLPLQQHGAGCTALRKSLPIMVNGGVIIAHHERGRKHGREGALDTDVIATVSICVSAVLPHPQSVR